MKKLIYFASLAILFFSCQETPKVEEAPTVKQYTIEQFIKNTSIGGRSFSHDENSILTSNNQTGIFNAWKVPVDGSGMTQLTNSEKTSVFAVSNFPNDGRFLFRSDNNGNEIFHLFVKNEDGSVQELTPDSTARASFYGWAHDLQSFYFGYTARDARYTDVYEMNLETFEPTMIYQNDAAYNFNGISDDKKYMAFSKSITTSDSDLFLYNRETEELTKINEKVGGFSAADFSKDGQSLYYLTNAEGEFNILMKYNIADASHEKVLEKDWDIAYSYFSHNGTYRVTGVNEDGKNVIEILNTETGEMVDFPKFETGDIVSASISRSENLMAFYVGSSASTSNLYVYNFETKEHKKLTNTLNAEINEADLVTAEVVRYPSFDDLKIPAIYYKPKQATAANPVPGLVWVHGGPGGQSRQSYFALIQYLVNHGYAVLAVNNRGSSGYGKTFFQMDDRNHGEKDLMDCIYGKKYLQTLDYIDKDKIGIIGGSYGGFMTMAALTRHPEEFEVGVDIFGVTNWLRTLKSIPPWWESFKDALYKEMGDPAQDSVRLYEISPLFHAEKIVKPVMVLQGGTDPRVLQVESDEIVEKVKKNGVPVEYVLFPDEGHGFVKKENQIEGYGKVLEFLDTYLKKAEKVKD